MRAGRPRSRVGILPSLLLLNGKRAGLPGRSPCRCDGAVMLGGPLCHFVDLSFFCCCYERDTPGSAGVSPA